jgi:hypothetical protein
MSKICRVHGWELMIQRYVLQQGLLLLSRLRMSYLYMNCEKLLWSRDIVFLD